jgi:hypothetical protein
MLFNSDTYIASFTQQQAVFPEFKLQPKRHATLSTADVAQLPFGQIKYHCEFYKAAFLNSGDETKCCGGKGLRSVVDKRRVAELN